MKILITGGTGTIGQALAGKLSEGNQITIYSRHESAQVAMRQKYPEFNYLIGDVRDPWAVSRGIKGQDYVFHLAALKHIDICEKQPIEAIETNVGGVVNVVNACKHWKVPLTGMSTDKAANPVNTYGMTKKLGEAVLKEANFIALRSGNVIGSSGSFIPKMIQSIKETNSVNLTDADMTRFFITVDDISSILVSLLSMKDGGVFVPAIKGFYIKGIIDMLIKKYGDKKTKIKIIGRRPGEQIREYLNAETEILRLRKPGLYEIFSESGPKVSSDDCLGDKKEMIKIFGYGER